MAYSHTLQSHLYSVYFAPRGYARMAELGMQIASQYLSPFDQLIGIIGEAGSGKSILVKGMFPGLELTNDDEGVNVRPLPLLDINPTAFYSAHTYHLDIRFESAFTQMHELADAIKNALSLGKRVVVEHFDLIYPILERNADILIGVGQEVVITRPNLFGPEPGDIAEAVFKSIEYRKRAHTAEDLVEIFVQQSYHGTFLHRDVRHGFIMAFPERPDIDIKEIEEEVRKLIAQDLPVSYVDETHVMIGDHRHYCTGPRIHVRSTGEIKTFTLIDEMPYDPKRDEYLLVGMVGESWKTTGKNLNKLLMVDMPE